MYLVNTKKRWQFKEFYIRIKTMQFLPILILTVILLLAEIHKNVLPHQENW